MGTEAAAFAILVGVAAVACPTFVRVAPGDPAMSHLSKKLAGTQTCGSRMPLGGPFLSAGLQQVVDDWIRGGALR